jgi:nucleotide-binding universal stress UspA family protein
MNTLDTKTRISIKNILYATDFSTAAGTALPYVLGLAQRYGARVHALHVRHPSPYPLVGPEAMPQIMETLEEQAKLDSESMHEMLAGVPHEVLSTEGDVWPNIAQVLEKENIDLIIIGTRGRTGIGRAVLGSVAEEILRRSPSPVLTVGPHISPNTKRRLEMKEILCAVDFSPESLAAIPYAVSLAQENQARLTVLHVVGEAKVGEFVHPEHYVTSTLRQLRKLVPPDADTWCEPNFLVERGPAADKIMETAIAMGTDLIVLGVRDAARRMGTMTHLLRPTAHKIVVQAECPVLTVRG